MKKRYEPKTLQQKLGYLIEECGEVQAAVGKTLRWGLHSHNPELPPSERESNRDWVLRELVDLERAIKYAREAIEDKPGINAVGDGSIGPTSKGTDEG